MAPNVIDAGTWGQRGQRRVQAGCRQEFLEKAGSKGSCLPSTDDQIFSSYTMGPSAGKCLGTSVCGEARNVSIYLTMLDLKSLWVIAPRRDGVTGHWTGRWNPRIAIDVIIQSPGAPSSCSLEAAPSGIFKVIICPEHNAPTIFWSSTWSPFSVVSPGCQSSSCVFLCIR